MRDDWQELWDDENQSYYYFSASRQLAVDRPDANTEEYYEEGLDDERRAAVDDGAPPRSRCATIRAVGRREPELLLHSASRQLSGSADGFIAEEEGHDDESGDKNHDAAELWNFLEPSGSRSTV